MTESSPNMGAALQHDASAVILARVEVKLDNALAEQARHSDKIHQLELSYADTDRRVVILETVAQAEAKQQSTGLTRIQLVWAAIGALAATAMMVTTIILALHRAGGHG